MGKALRAMMPSIASVVLALVLSFFIIVSTRGLSDAFNAYLAMLWGSIGDWPKFLSDEGTAAALLRPLGESGTKAALLILTGLSVASAFRVGLFNIGAQGQLLVGAIVAAWLGSALSLPAPIHIAVCVLAASLAGALYALIPALLKVKRGVHEVISTIMLNWVAVRLIENWLLLGPLKATASGDNSISGTAQIHASAELPRLMGDGSRLNLGAVLAVIVAIVFWVFLARTVRGFEWKVVGLAPEAAKSSGLNTSRAIIESMLVAGACAGLAGAVLILGTELKYPATLSGTWGFDGISMALIGQGHPLGVIFSALTFGALTAGGTRMQLFGVHKSFPELIQGIALLLMAARVVWARIFSRRNA